VVAMPTENGFARRIRERERSKRSQVKACGGLRRVGHSRRHAPNVSRRAPIDKRMKKL